MEVSTLSPLQKQVCECMLLQHAYSVINHIPVTWTIHTEMFT